MSKHRLIAIAAAFWCVTALAQEPAQDEGPRVNTSDIKPGELTQPAEAPTLEVPTSEAPPSEAPPAASPPTSRTSSGIVQTTSDRLELDTTVVTGNRELPKVLYIVPWKKADLGELPAQPFNTLLDEVLSPVDRDVFRREVTYYGVVAAGGQGAGAAGTQPPAEAGGTEK
jgi:hypothetical protein